MSRSRRTDFILWRSSAFLLDLMVIFTGKKFFGNSVSKSVSYPRGHPTWNHPLLSRHSTRHRKSDPRVARFVYIHILCHHSKFQSCLRINHNLAHITRDRVQCGTLYNRVALDTTQTLLCCLVFSLVWFWFSYSHNKVLI